MMVLGDRVHRTRKGRQCELCLLKIAAGDPYRRQFNVDGGEAWTHVSHVHCTRLATKMRMYADLAGEGLSDEYFQDDVRDFYWRLLQQGEAIETKDWPMILLTVLDHHGIKMNELEK